MVRSFDDVLFNDKITINEANQKRNNLLENIKI